MTLIMYSKRKHKKVHYKNSNFKYNIYFSLQREAVVDIFVAGH